MLSLQQLPNHLAVPCRRRVRHLRLLRTICLPRRPGTGPVLRSDVAHRNTTTPCPAYSIVVLHFTLASLAPNDCHSRSRARRDSRLSRLTARICATIGSYGACPI